MIEPTAGVFDGREHQLPVRIYYEDTDFTGIVYHANYLRYLERGRSDFFRAVGISHSELAEQDTGFAVIRMELDFKRAAKIDDALVVRTLYERIEGVRLHVSQKITRGDEVILEAKAVAVCISLSGRPRRPTAEMTAKLAPWLAPTAQA
ncbi:tol-pal system-associated acyl-CoA thioesterase [Caulobacter segnis]|uniref:Tol-pal system-associated acyl-CoA thioesterase n=2 Tax=Caulobacter segnis TaxID=88688 RepID=D5VEQ1_CAUST|nr:tol-pal system-associated acyl-CoA thioesterase [Caulobacter segnis]ADG09194.1 tol-pal system-associated acyl-CoA thioesterase [Caulobacter segnis ATCC 21756]AVQ01010.1 tol-pal system-associated acyl-CoA thioesterase [Caulobacter segnis]